MTSDDHPHLAGPRFDGTDHDDGYDPFVAEQFAVLDRVPVPEVGARPQPNAVPRQPVDVPRINRFDPRYVLAAAAAVMVVAAASFATLRGPGQQAETNATDNEGIVVQTDQQDPTDNSAAVQDGASDGEKLTVEVTPSSTASVATADGDSSTATSSAQTEASGDGSSEADGRQGANQGGSSVGGTNDTEGTTTTTASSADSSVGNGATTTPPTSSVLAPPTTKPASGTSIDVPVTSFPADGPDRIIIIRGTLTEVFTDCQSHLVLDDDGRVVPLSSVSCDGGSYIIVDGKMIRTSSGFVPADLYYNRHNSFMRPGQRIVVSAVPSELLANTWTLNCSSCSITAGGG